MKKRSILDYFTEEAAQKPQKSQKPPQSSENTRAVKSGHNVVAKEPKSTRTASAGDGGGKSSSGSALLLLVYTDGSCTNNGGKNSTGGIGVFFGPGDARNLSETGAVRPPLVQKITNQTMELMAVLRAVEAYVRSGDKRRLLVCSDSEYVVKSMTSWAKGWEKKGWRTSTGKPVANAELMQRLFELVRRHGVGFQHVPAHRDEPADRQSLTHAHWFGNMMADRMATARRELRE